MKHATTRSSIKHITVILILLIAIVCTYVLKKPKYQSLDILAMLDFPYQTENWLGQDMPADFENSDERYNFVNDVFARVYTNIFGENLLFMVVDAGNFHHPKVCFNASGFTTNELDPIVFEIKGRTVKAQVLHSKKHAFEFLLIYWICINKKPVDWTQQKVQQFWFSLFNKQKIGLMMRMDVPVQDGNTKQAVKSARNFLNEFASSLSEEQADYIFGLNP